MAGPLGRVGLLILSALQGGTMDGRTEAAPTDEAHRHPAEDPAPSLARLRSLYLLSVSDEAAIQRGLDEVERLRPAGGSPAAARLDATLDAYRGALVTLRAKHALWPPAKLRHLRRGLEQLDASVAAHPSIAEVRYLRLMSCFYLPPVLGRGASVREDFQALASLLPRQRQDYPEEVFYAIVRFVLQEGELSPEQRAPLESSLSTEDG